jgi:hypothetical protein
MQSHSPFFSNTFLVLTSCFTGQRCHYVTEHAAGIAATPDAVIRVTAVKESRAPITRVRFQVWHLLCSIPILFRLGKPTRSIQLLVVALYCPAHGFDRKLRARFGRWWRLVNAFLVIILHSGRCHPGSLSSSVCHLRVITHAVFAPSASLSPLPPPERSWPEKSSPKNFLVPARVSSCPKAPNLAFPRLPQISKLGIFFGRASDLYTNDM